jgi:hypothetical protein
MSWDLGHLGIPPGSIDLSQLGQTGAERLLVLGATEQHQHPVIGPLRAERRWNPVLGGYPPNGAASGRTLQQRPARRPCSTIRSVGVICCSKAVICTVVSPSLYSSDQPRSVGCRPPATNRRSGASSTHQALRSAPDPRPLGAGSPQATATRPMSRSHTGGRPAHLASQARFGTTSGAPRPARRQGSDSERVAGSLPGRSRHRIAT